MNFEKNICRICVNSVGNLAKIESATITCESNTILVLDLLNMFSDIKINDNYPSVICENCMEKATAVYKFKLQCDQSNEILKDYANKFDSNGFFEKFEIDDDSYDIKPQLDEAGNIIDTKTVLNTEEKKFQRKIPKKSQLYRGSKKRNKVKEVDKILFCNECNKHFKNKYILSAHIKRHENKGQFLCNICGKGFNSQSCLTRHTRVHTGEKNYECKVCHKKFPSSNNLNLHSRVHSGIKPYLCTMCGKSFSQPAGLTYHIKTHTKEKPYTCDMCGKSFALKCHVERHRKTHTGERPFACKQCDKAFIKKNDLQRHESIHNGVKPYVCEVCKKGFIQKLHLTYHTMVHTKEKPHVCPECGKGFIRRYYLKDHMNRRHGSIDNEDQENKTQK